MTGGLATGSLPKNKISILKIVVSFLMYDEREKSVQIREIFSILLTITMTLKILRPTVRSNKQNSKGGTK